MSFDPTQPMPTQPPGRQEPPTPPERPEPPTKAMDPQDLGAPPQDLGPSPQGYGPASPDFGPPPQGYGPPPQGYGPPPQGYGPPPQYAGKPRRRRRPVRRSVISTFIIIVLAALLLIADRVGNLIAENEMANQFTANGFPVKPSVNIEGFPFLTQVAAHDFRKVDVSASNIPAGPVTISSLNATLTGMHLSSSWNGATIDKISATAFVSFGALASAGGLGGTGITASQAGPDKLKVTASVAGLVSTSVEASIKQTGPRQITIKVLNDGGLSSLLSSFSSYTFSLPAGVPPSLRITGLTLNSAGLTLSAGATDATFSEPSK
jgi:LmeA-like phospholipid-binding